MAVVNTLNPSAPSNSHPLRQWLLLPIIIVFTLLVWQSAIWVNDFPAFILPSPFQVAQRFFGVVADGTLQRHTAVTLGEALSGLAVGLSVAAGLGYLLAQSPLLERLLAPYIVASQSIPIVAVAPLLIIWFGSGLASKVLICALIVFFPVLINVIVGLRSVEPDLRDLMLTLRASRWQLFVTLELPAALPLLLSGLKIGATLSVIGAVVGEFAGSNSGLGFLIIAARGQFDTALVFVAMLALIGIALSLYGAVVLLERKLLAWKN